MKHEEYDENIDYDEVDYDVEDSDIEEVDEEYYDEDEDDEDYDEDEDDEDYDEDEDDEDYDEDEDDEDEDEEEEGLTEKELALIAADYSEPVSEDDIEEIKYLFDNYFKIQKLSPELAEEKELKDYSLDVIRAIVMDYDIPVHDLAYLFKFVLVVESYYEKHSKDIIFTEVDKEEDTMTLKLRLDEYMNENPGLFEDYEVFESIFDIKDPLTKTATFKKTLQRFYDILLADADLGSFEILLDLYEENKLNADENLAKMPVPSADAEDLAVAFERLLNAKRSGSTIKKKIEESKALIAEKYPNDPTLAALLVQNEDMNTAKMYKNVKFGSLGVAIAVLILVNFIVGIVLLAAWGAMFFSPLHDKVPFLVKGKEATLDLNKK